jgi:hypothetical protein
LTEGVLLCDAHVPRGGFVRDGRLLLLQIPGSRTMRSPLDRRRW